MIHMKKSNFFVLYFVVLFVIGVVLIAISWHVGHPDVSTIKDVYQQKSDIIRSCVLADVDSEMYKQNDKFVVIMSSSNGEYRATVRSGIGFTLSSAWDNADSKLKAALSLSSKLPKWVKCDIVSYTEPITMPSLYEKFSKESLAPGVFHYGLTLDSNFETAVLEQEINAIRAYDYYRTRFDRDFFEEYIVASRGNVDCQESSEIFQCDAWICDENNEVYVIDDNGLNYGRRVIDLSSSDSLEYSIVNSGAYLQKELNGSQFTYIYYPQQDVTDEDYNIVRHAGALWSLSQAYVFSHDGHIKSDIQAGIKYIKRCSKSVGDAVYVITEDDGKFNLGAAGLSLIALTSYQDIFDDNKYEDFAKAIANGIIASQNSLTGQFVHSLNQDMSVDQEYVIVYYDGEAILGLIKLYNLTGDDKYLDAAVNGFEYLISNDYYTYADHWIAYCANELTKIYPDRFMYYDFMFKNLQCVIEDRVDVQWSGPTVLEALINSFECCLRAEANHIVVPEDFDKSELVDLIFAYIDRELSSYFYPEKAMYTANPNRCLNAFYKDTSKAQRIRIDDVQHNIGAMYSCVGLYEELLLNRE